MWDFFFIFYFLPESHPGQENRLPLSVQVCCSLNMIALKLALVILVSHTMCRGKPHMNNISCKKEQKKSLVRHSAELQISLVPLIRPKHSDRGCKQTNK